MRVDLNAVRVIDIHRFAVVMLKNRYFIAFVFEYFHFCFPLKFQLF